MALTTRVDYSIGASLTSPLDLTAEGRVALSWAKTLSLSSGSLADQADQLWFDERTLAASANDDLDLSSGPLLNGLGTAFSLARLKGLVVYSLPGNTNNINVGGGSNPLVNWVGAGGDIVVVVPGGTLILLAPNLAGYGVTNGSADILRISNAAGGSSVTYQVVLFGTTS